MPPAKSDCCLTFGAMISTRVLDVLPALEKSDDFDSQRSRMGRRQHHHRRSVVRQILPKLKAANAQGIVEYPLNKIVL